jgi:hypothetical protein
MKRKGINYDVGTHYAELMTRPAFDAAVAHRELEIIKNDLHCNAVRISGQDTGRLVIAAEAALEQGLEVWLSPVLHDWNEQDTLHGVVACAAAAESLRSQWPQLIFILGCELTIFMPGVLAVKAKTFFERVADPAFRQSLMTGAHNQPLGESLATASTAVRLVFHGQVAYASAPIEKVDWSLFDFVCLDYYRSAGNPNTIAQQLKPYFAHGKPVIITETGCCTYRGAENEGGMGWTIIDQAAMPARQLNGDYVRDEHLQATEVIDLLTDLDNAGVDGTFVYTFVIPALTHSENPRQDLDMASYGLVKSYARRYGTAYPYMMWEPKESFRDVAEYYADERKHRLP